MVIYEMDSLLKNQVVWKDLYLWLMLTMMAVGLAGALSLAAAVVAAPAAPAQSDLDAARARVGETTERLEQLLDQLEQAARPVAESELDALAAFMAEQGAEGAAAPAPWDIPFWSERQQEALYGTTPRPCATIFNYPTSWAASSI